MSNDTHDEGLVHSHAWACAERGRMVNRPGQREMRPVSAEEPDDGIVHDHGWACGERGRGRH